MNLTNEDIDFLLDCVDCRETTEQHGSMMTGMLEALMVRGDTELAAKLAEQREKVKRDEAAQRRTLRERCILIKAKLLKCRDEAEVNTLFDKAGRETAEQ